VAAHYWHQAQAQENRTVEVQGVFAPESDSGDARSRLRNRIRDLGSEASSQGEFAASAVLLTLSGSMAAENDRQLAALCREFVKAELERIRAK
jgi:hypothetical protein